MENQKMEHCYKYIAPIGALLNTVIPIEGKIFSP